MDLAGAIEKTIGYAKRHGGKLTTEELKERLISDEVYRDEEIENQLSVVSYQLSVRKRKNNKKLKRTEELVKEHLIKFKDILMVGVTGSVAAGYPKKGSDIDLLVVTRKERLWLTRLLLRVYIRLKGIPHRGYREVERADQFCFNLWLTEDSLQIPKERQRLRTAVDLILMKVMLNRRKTYEEMLWANNWVKRYVATGYQKLSLKFKVKSQKSKRGGLKIEKIGDVINWVVFWPQYWYMRKKISNEIIDINRAFFNR